MTAEIYNFPSTDPVTSPLDDERRLARRRQLLGGCDLLDRDDAVTWTGADPMRRAFLDTLAIDPATGAPVLSGAALEREYEDFEAEVETRALMIREGTRCQGDRVMEIVPYRAGDLGRVQLGYFDALAFPDQIRDDPEPHLIGNALSVVAGGEVLGVAAAYLDGTTVRVSMALSDELRAHPVFMHRSTKRGLQLLLQKPGVASVAASVHKDFAIGIKWLDRLGFAPSGKNGDYREYACVWS